jgi:hypothetical protein
MNQTDGLRNFIYQQVDPGCVLQSDMAYVHLGEERHGFYVWALKGLDPILLVDQFKRDIEAWVKAAGDKATIVMRRWPEMDPVFEGGFRLTARMLIVNRFYKSVSPSFMPKKEGEEAQTLGGSDDNC